MVYKQKDKEKSVKSGKMELKWKNERSGLK